MTLGGGHLGNTRPECFLRGLKFSGKKNKGSQIFWGKSKGSQIPSNQSLNKIFFEISIFLEVTDPNVTKIVTISDIWKADKIKKWLTSEIFERNKGCQIYMEKNKESQNLLWKNKGSQNFGPFWGKHSGWVFPIKNVRPLIIHLVKKEWFASYLPHMPSSRNE